MCHPAWARARVTAHHLAELARLRRVRDRIDREYARPLDIEALARDIGMPAGQLGRLFRAAYGDSPYGYLTRRRIERAAALLRCGGLDVVPSDGPGSTALLAARTETSRATGLAGAGARDVPEGAPEPVRIREAPATAPQLA
ncbi:helix-turn-helix domain-containing protein [Streptomyces sp. NPDC008121]|uniref:helix-turn-helix domain-containing protein n=1 Tax=Streptomyces sp. NPDC008121 TaxID=3364809 RepID=UPI0036F005E8